MMWHMDYLSLLSHDSLEMMWWWLFTSASVSSPAIFAAIRVLSAPATTSSSFGLIVVATTVVTTRSKRDKVLVIFMAFIYWPVTLWVCDILLITFTTWNSHPKMVMPIAHYTFVFFFINVNIIQVVRCTNFTTKTWLMKLKI